MTERLTHANCGGNIIQDLRIDSYKCDRCEEAGITIQHATEEGEVIILKETTEEEIEKVEEAADDQV
jgi:hypothetical protein